jgi:hypothetical protein
MGRIVRTTDRIHPSLRDGLLAVAACLALVTASQPAGVAEGAEPIIPASGDKGLTAGAGSGHADLVAAAPVGGPRRSDDASTLDVLVLGDSYSAGNGAGDYEGAAGCWRSPHNYGNEFGRLNDSENGTTTMVDTYACNGAVTRDFWKGRDGRPPMFEWVNHSYDTILLTVGGNDIHFAAIVKHCLVRLTRTEKHCDPNLDSAEKEVKGASLRANITRVLNGVRKRAAAGTRIVLLGYPYLEADDGSGFMLDDDPVGNRVRRLGSQGDKVQKAIVDELNAAAGNEQFVFLSTQALFAGKNDQADDLCGLADADAGHFHELQADATNRHRWMVQPSRDASVASWRTYYHPNPMGWCQEGQLLLDSDEVPTSPFRYDGGPIILSLTAGSTYSIPLPLSGGVLPVGLRPEGDVPPGVSASVSGRWVTLNVAVATPGDYSFSLNATDNAGKVVPLEVSLHVAAYVPGACFDWQRVGQAITITAGGWVSWGNQNGSAPLTNANLSAYHGTIKYGDGASEPIALNGGPYKHTYHQPGTFNARIVADGTLASNGRPCHDDVIYPVVVKPDTHAEQQ